MKAVELGEGSYNKIYEHYERQSGNLSGVVLLTYLKPKEKFN